MSSSDTDLPTKRVDSATEEEAYGNAAGLNTSDDTQLPSDTFEQQVFYKRELRPLREPKRTAPNTWVDADTTGDFDPHEEARQARVRRKKAKLSHRKKIDWISEGHAHDADNDVNLTAQPRLPLRLSFNTSSGKSAFNELDAKFQREVKPARDHFTAGYQLRKRDITGEGANLGIIGAKVAGVRLVGSEQPCDYSNHPVARGCVACLMLVRECSLLRNEHAWPCDECEDDDNDCQLVQVSNISFREYVSHMHSDNAHRSRSLNWHAHTASTLRRRRTNGSYVRSITAKIQLITAVAASDASWKTTNLASQALGRVLHVAGSVLLRTEHLTAMRPMLARRRGKSKHADNA